VSVVAKREKPLPRHLPAVIRNLVGYPRLKAGASCISPHHASPPTLRREEEVLGEAQPQAHQKGGTHPARFKRTREALRSRSTVKPQWAQWNTRSSKVRSRLIPPHRKHSREVLKAGTGKTRFPLFRNPHSNTALSSENEESYSPILLFPVPPLWIKPWSLNPLAPAHRTPVQGEPRV